MTRYVVLAAAFCTAWAATLAVAATPTGRQDVSPALEFRPVPAPVQPVSYSHRVHVEQGLACAECHATATTADRATLPPTGVCMECHAASAPRSRDVEKLADYLRRGEAVPWVRVYRLPTYVFFSHRVHTAGVSPLTCDSCHGDVAVMHATQKVRDTSMAACMECHRATSAPNLCDSCHEPL